MKILLHIIFLLVCTVTFGQPSRQQPMTGTNVLSISSNGVSPPTAITVIVQPSTVGPWNALQAFGPYVASIVALLAAFIALLKGRVDARYVYASEILKFRLRQIEEFYAPALLHIEQSTLVYNKLLWTIENHHKGISIEGFRLLDRIHEFQNDSKLRPLIDRIIAIGEELAKLISDKPGLIEGGVTRTFIEYKAHFEILKAASKQSLTKAQAAGWHELGYYPRMLTREIREGYKVVLEHLENHVSAGDKIIYRLWTRKRIDIGKYRRQLLENLHFYEEQASDYAAKYDTVDLSSCRARFIVAIEKARSDKPANVTSDLIKVLDAGCGTGRDTYEFIKIGYAVLAIDPCPAMLIECQKKLRQAREQPANEQMKNAAERSKYSDETFDELSFNNEFDGIWAAASLLHVPIKQMESNIRRLFSGLKRNGVFYMSFKHGHEEIKSGSRSFCYYSRRDIQKLLKKIPEAVEIDIWLSDANGKELSSTEQLWAWKLELFDNYDRLRWLNVLIRRKST